MSADVDTRTQTVSVRSPRLWIACLLLVVSLAPTVYIGVKFFGHTQQCVPQNTQTRCLAFFPGEASSATKNVETGDLPSNKHKGDVLFVTISLQGLNDLTLDMARREPNADLFAREQIYGTKTPSQNRKEDLKLMRDSKDFAAYVALRKLGYPVSVTGGGVVVSSAPCAKSNPDGRGCALPAPAAAVLAVQDVITAVDGVGVHTTADYRDVMATRRPGDRVVLSITRGKEKRTETVELIRPEGEDRAIIGFSADPLPPADITFTMPGGVKIDSGQVGGPSAGLAFTLALLDELTPGELTGGVKVAATGEIRLNGDVGAIGGLRQKTVAVQRSGAKVFLVPGSELEEAQRAAKGSSLKVIGVDTLDDALKALADLGGNALELGTPGATAR